MKRPLEEFSLDDLKSAAPAVNEREIISAQPETEAFVHCECALAVAMKPFNLGRLEIGMSRDCCWPCLEFLGQYSIHSGKIVVSAKHGKTHQSWLCPANLSSDIYHRIEETARSTFFSWLVSLNERRDDALLLSEVSVDLEDYLEDSTPPKGNQ